MTGRTARPEGSRIAAPSPWPLIEPIRTAVLHLEPLSLAHATDMASVLADPALYRFTGGEPPSLPVLERRYAAQSAGHSADGSQWWLNWVLREKCSGEAAGYVQATVQIVEGQPEAGLAWVVATRYQGRGFATSAATAIMSWLRERGVTRFAAFIHPANLPSAAVARKIGLHLTPVVVDGEARWETGPKKVFLRPGSKATPPRGARSR